MATVGQVIPPLKAGQRLTRAEFLRRWEALPNVPRAELLGGVVHMPSPVGLPHARMMLRVSAWLTGYVAATPGCDAGSEGTWLMHGDETPQPDLSLWILPECGGQSTRVGNYPQGAPELLVEVSGSSLATDLGEKLALYLAAGVREYVVVALETMEILWHRRDADQFTAQPPQAAGIWKSLLFPGLWLDGPSLFAWDVPRVMEVLAQGLASAEHQRFVAELHQRRNGANGD